MRSGGCHGVVGQGLAACGICVILGGGGPGGRAMRHGHQHRVCCYWRIHSVPDSAAVQLARWAGPWSHLVTGMRVQNLTHSVAQGN